MFLGIASDLFSDTHNLLILHHMKWFYEKIILILANRKSWRAINMLILSYTFLIACVSPSCMLYMVIFSSYFFIFFMTVGYLTMSKNIANEPQFYYSMILNIVFHFLIIILISSYIFCEEQLALFLLFIFHIVHVLCWVCIYDKVHLENQPLLLETE